MAKAAMDTPIEAKVAAIIDDTTLVLNVGYAHGVREGVLFVIFGEHEAVTDPATGESLGQWESVKARVVATHVQERMCTVRAPVIREKPVTDGTRPLSALMIEHSLGHYGPRPEEWQRLEVRRNDMSGRPRGQPIAVGDGARSLPLEPEETPVAANEESGDQAEPDSADHAAPA